MSEKLDDYVKQTYRYFYGDGLVELAIGLLFVIVGGVLFAWQNLGQSVLLDLLLAAGLVTAVIGGIYLINRIIPKLKQRVTYPRTGYVAYRKEDPNPTRWYLMAAVLILLFIVSFLPVVFNKMQFMVGSILAVVLCLVGYRVNLWRFYLLGAGALVIGIGATLTLADEVSGTAFVFLVAGCLLLVSGGLALARYLRQHPQAEDEAA